MAQGDEKEGQEVRHGFACLPPVPTEAMLTAGVGELLGYAWDYESPRDAVVRIYAAMVEECRSAGRSE